ncbi:protein of unknown function [Chryseobacterium formosense]|nr:protein of unknown function [Chryseobacterium formosense]
MFKQFFNCKKILFFLLLVVSFLVSAQKMVLLPTGLMDAENVEVRKNYIVLNIANKTSKQLYDESIKFINKNYKNPDEVIKGKTEGEYLKFVTYAPHFINVKNGLAKVPFNVEYTTELSFKDGRVKYEIIDLRIFNDSNYTLNITGGGISFFIFNKKGELKKEETKIDIENYFNKNISILSDFLKGENSENW